MYVIPFSMGPVGSTLSKYGVQVSAAHRQPCRKQSASRFLHHDADLFSQVTDSPYVVASMGIMTRMGTPVLNKLAEGVEFVRCQHSLGRPLPLKGTYFQTVLQERAPSLKHSRKNVNGVKFKYLRLIDVFQ